MADLYDDVDWGDFEGGQIDVNQNADYMNQDYSFSPEQQDSAMNFDWGTETMPENQWDFQGFQNYQQGGQNFAPGSVMDTLNYQAPPLQSTPQMPFLDNSQGWDMGSVAPALAKIFQGPAGGLATKGLGALLEGYQNKKKAGALRDIVSSNQAAFDPFGSQRPMYQRELQRAVQDPYSAPIVRDQVAQLQAAQARKDAAAGRRSNNAGSAPALLAAQAQIAQDYIKSLYTPAGANISPNSGAIMSMLNQATDAGVNGYLSPAMNALSNYLRTQEINDLIAALKSK